MRSINDGIAILFQPWRERVCATPIVGIVSVKAGTDVLDFDSPLNLRHDQNHVQFSFLSYNFRMGSHSLYRYRLLGLHDDWIETANTSAEYWALRPHEYIFEVQSINEDGVWSDSQMVVMNVRPHFSQTWWFRLLIVVVLVCCITLSIRWWHRSKQNALLQRAKVAELKQQALNANMNPHFIFNALNSIQHLVLKNQTLEANEFLTDFSKLIRMNLEANSEQLIVLEEELERLELYLKLEQLRFGEQLTYHIQNHSNLYLGALEIPPMFLQPFVENAILHGILPSGRAGHIEVEITDAGESYCIEIRDNGIGLRAAALNQRPGHRSLATRINAERLEILQNISGLPCSLLIEEQLDKEQICHGTVVKVRLPKHILS
jgi:anti-sigma regulatory factor (Ser/Thr protein kinase)